MGIHRISALGVKVLRFDGSRISGSSVPGLQGLVLLAFGMGASGIWVGVLFFRGDCKSLAVPFQTGT